MSLKRKKTTSETSANLTIREENKKSQKPQKSQKSQKPISVFEQVYELVLAIPSGKVMTYRQISLLLDERLSAAGVGWAMRATPNDERKIPWHRIINSRGGISTNKTLNFAPNLQQRLLEAENVVFNEQGLIDLNIYQWKKDNTN
ncbi:MAG: MGMT family protein [Acidobacteria bacterium]|nr:MGMT family protein [Acidobacteriota bacterium]